MCRLPVPKAQRTYTLQTNGVNGQCLFESEGDSCDFCALHGAKCGPKVYAEKARSHCAKLEQYLAVETTVPESLEFPSNEEPLREFDVPDGSSDTKYLPPLAQATAGKPRPSSIIIDRPDMLDTSYDFSSGLLPISIVLIIEEAISLSTPSTMTMPPEYFPGFYDAHESYVAASLPLLPQTSDFLPLYVDIAGEEYFDWPYPSQAPTIQYKLDENSPILPTLMCLQQWS
jgi:hypothetical protein